VAEKHVIATWDWKEQPLDDDGSGALGSALRRLGIYVYPTPSDEGSDQFGFIFSTESLTQHQVKEIDDARYK